MEVKYQKVTYRRYFTKVKYKKVSTKVGNLRSATKHTSGAFGPGTGPVSYKPLTPPARRLRSNPVDYVP